MSARFLHLADLTRVWDTDGGAASGTAPLFYPGTYAGEESRSGVDVGERTWVFVQNGSGAAWAAGEVIQSASAFGFDGEKAAADAHPMIVLGVAQHAIADGESGWILCHGRGTIKANSTAITDEALLIVTGTGVVGAADSTDATTNDAHLVIAVAAEAITASSTGLAFINCRHP